MKKLSIKTLIVILLSVWANMLIGHIGNPAGIAFFCAAYTAIPAKMLLAVATLVGMVYALPISTFIKYTGFIVTVMAMMAIIIKLRKIKTKMVIKHPSSIEMFGVMALVLITMFIGYVVAFGDGWQSYVIGKMPVILIQLSIIISVYWASSLSFALLNGWRPDFERSVPSMRINEETMVTKSQLHAFSESFRKLSESFQKEAHQRNSLNQQELQDVFNSVTEQVCKDCSRCTYCWENMFEDSYENAYEILDLCAWKTEMKKKDLPERFRQRCVRSDSFLAEARRMIGLAQTNLNWQNRLVQSQIALAGQFGEVAEVIGNFSEQIGDEEIKQGSEEKQIVKRLNAKKIQVKRIAASTKSNGRHCLYIEAKTAKGDEKPLRQISDIIGNVYGHPYLPMADMPFIVDAQWRMFAFEEDVNYRTIIGDARMVRMGENVSGDSYTVMHMDSGQVVMSLSDGMGSGEIAQKESNRIISLLEQLLSTGFNRQSAIKLIHSVVLAGSDVHTYSTLDLCTLDLFNGSCELIKMGAAASFIKNGDYVKIIVSDSLPPGALSEANSEVQTTNMQDGDLIVMVSDGVLNSLGAVDNEEKMVRFLRECQITSPQQLANIILNYAMASCRYEVEDDMTVLVCGMYKKQDLS